jgi:hypothetical protein
VRSILFIISATLLFSGCEKSSDSVEPMTDQTMSTGPVSDSILYTFAIPKAVFGIHDTLSATLTAHNESSTLTVFCKTHLTKSLLNQNMSMQCLSKLPGVAILSLN